MTLRAPEEVKARIREADALRLFLDYDGTLADFAPTPEHVEPDQAVIALVTRLAEHPRIQVAVVSGRRLAHVEKLLPVPEVLLAGTYGVELRLPSGERVNRVPFEAIRPVLEEIKPRWRGLIADRKGFFLEDKDWALAIHALHAADEEASDVLGRARRFATGVLEEKHTKIFRVLGGHKFLEVGPALAHKGKTADTLLERFPSPGALPLYVGDDDKDEEAFEVIHAHGGVAIKVCEGAGETKADGWLASPEHVQHWLETLLSHLGETES